MRATRSAHDSFRWLRSTLAMVMAVGVLLGSAPSTLPSFAQPTEQIGVGVGARDADLCRDPAPPLLLNYDDIPNGITLRYPDRWTWRIQSGALPGTRSELVL